VTSEIGSQGQHVLQKDIENSLDEFLTRNEAETLQNAKMFTQNILPNRSGS